jgi:hypothetical protein
MTDEQCDFGRVFERYDPDRRITAEAVNKSMTGGYGTYSDATATLSPLGSKAIDRTATPGVRVKRACIW